ncbi:VWA domain-containing protein [Amycolatopsis australiensis]|uniref:VWA domain containing CoxE-like protein n=1 Tax=Amycolatopsis australiensis TaxID=546364 RepID=A0A1K1STP5_9PSEU|nr:VWA domain-containing protein [Amycolatopsis australiensis]SFW87705.1 VWA domain containing CoxE-like protein [Amycolatopsis australiensis]
MSADTERARRWRLVLGAEGAGAGSGLADAPLSDEDSGVDAVLAALYDKPDEEAAGGPRSANLGASAPRVARWLGDIRRYFPSTVVQVMQRDAVDRLGLTRMLLEKELLSAVEPDVHLVGTLLSLNGVLPEETKETAREVVRKVVEQLEERLAERTRAAITGALDKASRTQRPRPGDVDWARTIHANLKHYSPELGTIVPEKVVGFGRRRQAVQRDVVLAVDQSGSMAESVVYSGLFGAVLASMRALKTSFVAFDTEVADLTEHLADPVDVLFGTQLGGGTDINRAIAYCQGLVERPERTLLVLISDLYEGGDEDELLHRIGELVGAGVQVVTLLALSDSGAPSYDHENAAALAELGVPAFACTPDQFPDLMAAAVRGDDLQAWVAKESS